MIGISFVYPGYLWLLLLIPLTIGLVLAGRLPVRAIPARLPGRLSPRDMARFSTGHAAAALSPRAWVGLALRVLLLLLIILALSGIQLRLPSRTLTAVFVLDVSDSIPPAEQARGEAFIRQAIQNIPSGDQAAVVVFGEDALVERLASPQSSLSQFTSVPVTTRTDIASALQLAMALFPDEGARRVVLLSDGRENLSYALKQAELAAVQDIELQYVSLGEAQDQVEVLINALEAPASVRKGQDFDLGISLESSAAVGATLRVFADGELFHTQELSLRPGANRYSVPVQGLEPGFRRFRAQVIPDADNRLQNNEAGAFTVVHGPPAILLVEGTPGEGANLAAALESAEMQVSRITPTDLPPTLPELARYDAVILANVPASALPAGAMEALPIYVRDLGKGLLMTGGENAFGAGGYLRTPLETAMPVFMDVKSRELAANLALIVAVDKSGSMGRCHCDDPDLNQTYTAVESGQPKVDIAKEAIMRSAAALGDEDYLGVVAFDSQARWPLQPQRLPSMLALENAIGSFQAEGSTNMYTGVLAAYESLEGIDAKRKHIILMTDGWVHTGDVIPLATQMREEGITLSVIAAGEGSAEYLELLAAEGGGRYYPATDMMSVPDIFLKETVKSVGQYIIEEPFFPLPASLSPVLRGIDGMALPGLLGYNGTSPKNTARIDLLTPRGDPLLASWQYGLGRAAAWTSDMKGQWATEWVTWPNYARFSAQLVGWLLPAPQVEGFDARATIQEEGALIRLEARDEAGRPLNYLNVQARLIDPALETLEIALEQVGPGQYQAVARADQPGAYLVWLGIKGDGTAAGQDVPAGQMTLGLVVPYSPEYRAGGINIGLLSELARLTGGESLTEPAAAFLHNLPAADSAREIWRALLLAAALLFPVDVALRRLVITRRDLHAARAWLSARVSTRRAAEEWREAPILSQLFSARERARERADARTRERERPPAPPPQPDQPLPSSDETAAPPPAAPIRPAESQEEALARLREAKKRARR